MWSNEPPGDERPPPRPLKGCAWVAILGSIALVVVAYLALEQIGAALR